MASDVNRVALALLTEADRLGRGTAIQRWRTRHLRRALTRIARIALDTTHTYDLPAEALEGKR